LGFPNQDCSEIQHAGWDGGQYEWANHIQWIFASGVVAAVETGGLSCHQAAAQFGVGVSTAIVWVRRLRETGSIAPGQMGGHKPKAISGDHRAWLLERAKAPRHDQALPDAHALPTSTSPWFVRPTASHRFPAASGARSRA